MAAVAAGLAVLVSVSGGAAATASPRTASSAVDQAPSGGQPGGVPQTAEEHFARAAAYKEKAAAYRREAEEHRKMLADYKARQTPPGLETKLGQEPPWVKKMRRHCERYITAADHMATEAEQFAEFHRLRGEEMRGK
jgi:hypothetical protein